MGTVFDTLAQDYQKYRHNYPEDLYTAILKKVSPATRALDVACGTGKSSEPLVRAKLKVFGVDLSMNMLGANSVVDGRKMVAKADLLPFSADSFNLVTCAQAFHWMDAHPTLIEFKRVLKPGGLVAIYWALLEDETTPFLLERKKMIRLYNPEFQPDRERVKDPAPVIRKILGSVETLQFSFTRTYTLDDFVGFHQSASYFSGAIPESLLGKALEDLRNLCRKHFPDGSIPLTYICPLYLSVKTS